MQRPARGTSSGDGNVNAEEYPAIQTYRVRLSAEHDLLRRCWGLIHRLRRFPTPVAGMASRRLFDDRAGFALGSRGELLGEQEI